MGPCTDRSRRDASEGSHELELLLAMRRLCLLATSTLKRFQVLEFR